MCLFCFNSQHTTNPQATHTGSNETGKMDKQKPKNTGIDKLMGSEV